MRQAHDPVSLYDLLSSNETRLVFLWDDLASAGDGLAAAAGVLAGSADAEATHLRDAGRLVARMAAMCGLMAGDAAAVCAVAHGDLGDGWRQVGVRMQTGQPLQEVIDDLRNARPAGDEQ